MSSSCISDHHASNHRDPLSASRVLRQVVGRNDVGNYTESEVLRWASDSQFKSCLAASWGVEP